MKYKSVYFTIVSLFLKKPMIKKFGKIRTKSSLKKGKKLYREMIEKTEDIGENNPMALNIYMGYVFMAICRAGKFCVDDFKEVTTAFINRKLIKKAISKLDINKSEDTEKMSKRMHQMSKWADEHPEYKDKTWDFNFNEDLHRDGLYYYFTRCPMEKFARENGYLDILPICCDIDYLTIGAQKAVLYRENTLASGGEICDYWIVGDENKNPK